MQWYLPPPTQMQPIGRALVEPGATKIVLKNLKALLTLGLLGYHCPARQRRWWSAHGRWRRRCTRRQRRPPRSASCWHGTRTASGSRCIFPLLHFVCEWMPCPAAYSWCASTTLHIWKCINLTVDSMRAGAAAGQAGAASGAAHDANGLTEKLIARKRQPMSLGIHHHVAGWRR